MNLTNTHRITDAKVIELCGRPAPWFRDKSDRYGRVLRGMIALSLRIDRRRSKLGNEGR